MKKSALSLGVLVVACVAACVPSILTNVVASDVRAELEEKTLSPLPEATTTPLSLLRTPAPGRTVTPFESTPEPSGSPDSWNPSPDPTQTPSIYQTFPPVPFYPLDGYGGGVRKLNPDYKPGLVSLSAGGPFPIPLGMFLYQDPIGNNPGGPASEIWVEFHKVPRYYIPECEPLIPCYTEHSGYFVWEDGKWAHRETGNKGYVGNYVTYIPESHEGYRRNDGTKPFFSNAYDSARKVFQVKRTGVELDLRGYRVSPQVLFELPVDGSFPDVYTPDELVAYSWRDQDADYMAWDGEYLIVSTRYRTKDENVLCVRRPTDSAWRIVNLPFFRFGPVVRVDVDPKNGHAYLFEVHGNFGGGDSYYEGYLFQVDLSWILVNAKIVE